MPLSPEEQQILEEIEEQFDRELRAHMVVLDFDHTHDDEWWRQKAKEDREDILILCGILVAWVASLAVAAGGIVWAWRKWF